jgi:hypothetical protein
MERVYAVIAKNKSGARYNIRLKYPERDGGRGLLWPSDLYGDHYASLEGAKQLAEDRGWVVVRNWKHARQLEKER